MSSLRYGHHSQRGAFSILSAFTLVMAILFLALVVDTGRLYLEQRKLQKLADTAALESISRLESGNCSLDTAKANAYALENAASYGFTGSDQQSLTSSCVSIVIDKGLRKPIADVASGRAVEVITSNQVPASIIVRTGGLFGLPGNSTVNLQATAVAEKDTDPLAVFSVGAQLLDLNSNGVLPRLLKAAGADISSLTLLDSEGLANAQVTPGELLQALGVEVGINQLKALTPEGLVQLAGTKVNAVGIQKLIDVSANLVTHDQTLAADIKALSRTLTNSQLKDATVNLLATADRPGLLQLATGPGQAVGSALDAKLALGDVLSTGLMTAVQGRGLQVSQLDLFGGAGKIGALSMKMGVVEPPSIGIGPVGTTAYNAQMRLQLDVNSSNLPVLGPLLNFLGSSVNLPLTLDLANAKGELTDINCSLAAPEATIDVESRIGNLCLGGMPGNSLWSTTASCTESNLQEVAVLKLANIDLIKGKAAVPLLSTANAAQREAVTLAVNESAETGINNLALGPSITALVQKTLDLIKIGVPHQNSAAGFSPEQAAQIADRYIAENGYNRTKIRDALIRDKLNWTRPGLAGLANSTMPVEWYDKFLLVSCSANQVNCRTELVKSLQTPAQNGLLGEVLAGVGQVLGLLGANTQPLLANAVGPLLALLEPILNSVGTAVSNLLKNLGLELGKSEIKVHSISCGIPRLVQ